MKKDTDRKRRWADRIKQEPPDHLDQCKNPDCSYIIPRWDRLMSSFIPKYCCIQCANMCRPKNKGNSDVLVVCKPRPKVLPCHKLIMGSKDRKIACDNYIDCLELMAINKKPDCTGFKEPDIQIGTVGSSIGGSMALCVNRDNGHR